MVKDILKEKLKELRNSRGEKQEQLGEIIGFKGTTVSQYESGTREPDLETLVKISTHYGVSCDYLLTGQDKQNIHIKSETLLQTTTGTGRHQLLDVSDDQDLVEIVETYFKLKPTGKEMILNTIRNVYHYESSLAASSDLKKA